MTPKSIPIWISLIGNFGFPIAITVLLDENNAKLLNINEAAFNFKLPFPDMKKADVT